MNDDISQDTLERVEDHDETGGAADNNAPVCQVGTVPKVERPVPAFRDANYANYTWSPIDPSSAARLAHLDEDSRRGYEKLGYMPDLQRFPLGQFQVDEHSVVSFEVIPEIGEVAYSEFSEYPAGTAQAPDKGGDDAPSPLLRFLQVTDKTVPVPLMLREFEDRSDNPAVEKLLKARDIVDTMDDHGSPGLAAPVAAQAKAEPGPVWTCFTGGLHTFENTYCQNKDISYCDNGAWHDLTRSTGTKTRYVSHSRIAACSNYGVYVEHQFRFWSWTDFKWKWTTVKYPLPPAAWWQTLGHGDVKYWKHVGSKKRRRKIRAWRGGPSGYFRAWTAFYN